MGHAGFGERLLLGFSRVVAHLRHEWNHASAPEGACVFHCWAYIGEVQVGDERATCT